jgi:ATP-dependent RNA helicase DDX23/PRP28
VKEVLDAMPSSNLKSENEEIAEKQEAKGFLYRTTIMYSATMPTAVERIARTYLRRAVYIMIGMASFHEGLNASFRLAVCVFLFSFD